METIMRIYRLRERKERNLYEITLPKEWIKGKGLVKGDKLVIIENERGELVIRRP